MSLMYRSVAIHDKVAELVIEGSENIVCVLIDKTLRTEERIQCRDLHYAERLVEQFLRPKIPH